MHPSFPISTADLRIRDPFIVTDGDRYLMYAQALNRAGSGYKGVEVYTSTDLAWWSQPVPVLTLTDERVQKVWAPEVHRHGDAWHLLVTLTYPDPVPMSAAGRAAGMGWPITCARGTWHFRADTPYGPFRAEDGHLLTPPKDMALDGTLWREGDDNWLVYCHEWVQLVDGQVVARRLDRELRPTAEPPVTLFRASDAACSAAPRPGVGTVTDGPFLFRRETGGSLFLLWSTMDADGIYVLLAAESPNGSVLGPWVRQHVLLQSNGGHGMVFTDLAGSLRLAVHEPNTGPAERLRLLRLDLGGAVPRVLDGA